MTPPTNNIEEYDAFEQIDGSQYTRINEFLRDRTHITAREWAIARLCGDFRTETGVEMTRIGENLPDLVPFMTDMYSPQAVNQARSSFKGKVRKAAPTFFYGAFSGCLSNDEIEDLLFEGTEVAKYLLEVEGEALSHEKEQRVEQEVADVMREIKEASRDVRYDSCPHCGEELHLDE